MQSREPLTSLLEKKSMGEQNTSRTPLMGARHRPWTIEFGSNGRGTASLTSFTLGLLCGVALFLPMVLPGTLPFAVYYVLLTGFHMSEYLLTAAFRPDILTFDNFLLNHSLPYQVPPAA